MGTPHKHAEVIKAWADGAEIEWFDTEEEEWFSSVSPFWSENTQYRIKPEPKPDVIKYVGLDVTGKSNGTLGYEVSQKLHNDEYICNHWSHQLKVTFDGETNKLKAVEIIK